LHSHKRQARASSAQAAKLHFEQFLATAMGGHYDKDIHAVVHARPAADPVVAKYQAAAPEPGVVVVDAVADALGMFLFVCLVKPIVAFGPFRGLNYVHVYFCLINFC